MSNKTRKNVKLSSAEMDVIKVEGLKQFVNFTINQPLRKRFKFALKIIFKRFK